MTDRKKDVDLLPSEWERNGDKPAKQPILGRNWWVLIAIPSLIAFLTFFGGPDGPAWVRAIALALR
jgi:hypothetical protein